MLLLPLRVFLALTVSVACSACQKASASADSNTETPQGGERIFQTVCARCHGAEGKGGPAVGKANPPRNFCDAAFQATRSDEDLKQTIKMGKGGMPAFGNLFSPSDLDGLVHKIRTFAPSNVTPPGELEKAVEK